MVGPVIGDDPRLQKFFNMVKYGVVPFSIKGMMEAQGFHPDLLDIPDKPVSEYEHMFPASDADSESDDSSDSE